MSVPHTVSLPVVGPPSLSLSLSLAPPAHPSPPISLSVTAPFPFLPLPCHRAKDMDRDRHGTVTMALAPTLLRLTAPWKPYSSAFEAPEIGLPFEDPEIGSPLRFGSVASGTRIRPLGSDLGGRGAGAGQPRLPHPPPYIRQGFPQGKGDIYRRGRKSEVDLWPLTPPPGLLLRGSGWVKPPPPQSGAESLEAPKKIFGRNSLAPKAPEKIVDWPKAWKKIWPNHSKGRGGGVGAPPPPPPPGPSGAELFKGALP